MSRSIPHPLHQASVRLAFALLVVSYLVVFWASRHAVFGDQPHYLALADSLLHGKFTPDTAAAVVQLPDKLRNPGYPAFLATFEWAGFGLLVPKVVQLLLTFLAIILTADLLRKLARRNALDQTTAVTIFLVLCALNVQFAFYAANIASESTMTLCMVAFLTFLYRDSSVKSGIGAGVAAGIGFMLRPTILFLPFLVAAARLRNRRSRLSMVALLSVYAAFLCGSGLFNLRNNGVFAIGPLEGSSYFFHLGFWQHKIPGGRTTRHYDGIDVGHEHMEQPTAADIKNAMLAYESDWDAVDAVTRGTLNSQDLAYITAKGGDPNHPSRAGVNFGPAYQAARNKTLRGITLRHIMDEPWYYLRTRVYNAFRVFVPNIETGKFAKARWPARLQLIWATGCSFATFICGLIVVAYLMLQRRLDRKSAAMIGGVILYFWAIHLPMNLAARYTIPIQLPAIALVSLAIARLLERHAPKRPVR